LRKEPETKEDDTLEMDPELARYLDRSFWEKKQQKAEAAEEPKKAARKSEPTSILSSHAKRFDAEPAAPQASAPPIVTTAPMTNSTAPVYSNDKYVNGETPLVNDIPPSSRATANPLDDDVELTDFVANLRSQLEIFTNRIESDRTRGRSIAVDSSVQTLFMNITSLHSTLMRKTQALEESKIYFEGLQDRLTQLKDARAALDALREEHYERIRREEEEAARQRQMQMAHKLAIMRKKKHEYLEYQRQLALQRMQEEERILNMKQAMGPGMPMGYGPGAMPMQMPGPGMPGSGPMPGVMPDYGGPMPGNVAPAPMPGAPPHQQNPGAPPDNVYPDGSPVHQQHQPQPQAPYYGAPNPGQPPMAHPQQQQQQQPGMNGMAPYPGYQMPQPGMQPAPGPGQTVPNQQTVPQRDPEPEPAPLISFD
jgi:growth factor-regulated tyrosine kinase substrate